MKHKESCGPDSTGISMKMLSFYVPVPAFFNSMLKLCQLSFDSGTFPSLLRVYRFAAIPKTNNPVTVKDFRPVSISPHLALLLKDIYHDQLQRYVKSKNILAKCQLGFRQAHLCEHAIIGITDMFKKHLESGSFPVVVSLDFASAFPSVHSELLMRKLRKYDISDYWIRSFLHQRKQFIVLNGEMSQLMDSYLGVPSGTINGPELFTLFVNDLHEIPKYGPPFLFADDHTLIFLGKVSEMLELQGNLTVI